MTTRYDAWSELDPAVSQALRTALYTGDWDAFEPEVVDAFRQAFNGGDWSGFDPQTAMQIRAAIGQEQLAVEARGNQERFEVEAKADRALAAEMRELGAKYTDFHANAAAILSYALQGNLSDLDTAYRAWRSSNGHVGPALAQASEPSPIADKEKSLGEMNERLEKLKLGDLRANDAEIRDLTWKRDDLRDELGLALLKGANPDEGRRDLIHSENEAKVRRNRERTTSISRGYADESPRESKDGRNARLDREALDMVQGRTAIPEEPKVSIPNAEAVIEQAAAELTNE